MINIVFGLNHVHSIMTYMSNVLEAMIYASRTFLCLSSSRIVFESINALLDENSKSRSLENLVVFSFKQSL